MSRRGSTPPGFWAAWTAVAVDLLSFGIVIPLLPLYAESFGAGAFVIGLLFASFSLGQLVFAPVWGRVSDRVGRKPVLLVTIAGSAVGSLVVGLAGSIAVLFVGRIVDGVSGASVAVARATVADVATPEQRPRLMGLLGAAFGLGFVIGPAIGSLAALAGPAVPFLVAAGISVLNLVATAVRLPETRHRDEAPASPPPPALRDMPAIVLRLLTLTFVGATAFSAFEATFALLGDRRLGMDDSTVGLVFAGVGAVLVAAQGGLVGPAARRLGETGLTRAALCLNVGGFLLLAEASSWPVLILSLALLASGQGLLSPILSSAVAGAVPADRAGTALGFQQSAGGLARVLGPLLGGALFAVGIPLPYLVAAALTLVALPLVPAAGSRRVRASTERA